jgi:class 3 adenylate cyclase
MDDTTLAPFAPARQAVSRQLARYFLVHLHAELQKPDSVLQEVHTTKPVRQMTRELVARTEREFGIDPAEPLPTFNIFRRWVELNDKFSYDDSAFIAYNGAFIFRLLDLRDGTPESRANMIQAMRAGYGSFDYEQQGFTVSFFLDSESVVREVLRQTVRNDLPEWAEEGDWLILSQSRAHQTNIYEYFEGLLKTTLAENERLLHGILPQQVATELKRNGHVEPVLHPEAAVLFTDFERFSEFTAHLPPCDVIHRLDAYFTEFDRISAVHGLEKIKTIGDSYMAVAGVPEPHRDPARAACDAALEIAAASDRISQTTGTEAWNIRIGIHVGPLIAGVIGKQKFSYDVWGATVNFASRMESSGAPGRINVSADIYRQVEPYYRWEIRGLHPVKRLGLAEMFFLLGKKD